MQRAPRFYAPLSAGESKKILSSTGLKGEPIYIEDPSGNFPSGNVTLVLGEDGVVRYSITKEKK